MVDSMFNICKCLRKNFNLLLVFKANLLKERILSSLCMYSIKWTKQLGIIFCKYNKPLLLIIISTYSHNQLFHAVRSHTVKVGEMQLQVNLVAQDILAQWAADNWLHGMLGHHMELHTVCVFTAVVAIWTLLNLKKTKTRCCVRHLVGSEEKNIQEKRNPVQCKLIQYELLFAQNVLFSGWHFYTAQPLSWPAVHRLVFFLPKTNKGLIKLCRNHVSCTVSGENSFMSEKWNSIFQGFPILHQTKPNHTHIPLPTQPCPL